MIIPAGMINQMYFNATDPSKLSTIWYQYPKRQTKGTNEDARRRDFVYCKQATSPGYGFSSDLCNGFAYCFDGFSCTMELDKCADYGNCRMGQFDAEIMSTFLRLVNQIDPAKSLEVWQRLPKSDQCKIPEVPGAGKSDDGCEGDEWCIDGRNDNCAKNW
jgi:hypothetical protein